MTYEHSAHVQHEGSHHRPNFSFDKFEAQIVALIQMAVFADEPEMLSCYHGGKRDERFRR